MNKKGLILGAIIIALTGAFVAYQQYNKPHADINEMSADFEVRSTDLIEEFGTDEAVASTKYTDKTLEVHGIVHKVDKGEQNQLLLFDDGKDHIVSIELLDPDSEVEKGMPLTVRAFYTGLLEGDPSFGLPGDIQLKKGIIIE